MRAAATLWLLAAWGANVDVLVIPIYQTGPHEPEPRVAHLCQSWHIATNPGTQTSPAECRDILGNDALPPPREWRHYNKAWRDEVACRIRELRADLIVLFRFYLLPFVTPGADGVPVWLDIDELESRARTRLAHILTLAGKNEAASAVDAEARTYDCMERHHLSCFQRIFVSSNVEAAYLQSRHAVQSVRVLPNTYPDIRPQRQSKRDGAARLLFVGTFGHYPNVDAAAYFCRDVLPRIRARAPRPIEVDLVGSGLVPRADLASMPGVHFVGPVAQTTSSYAACDAVIVPLRAAGGTRIKILEAFSHARAVVSTSVGAEGLDVVDTVHLRIGDTPTAFAEHCTRLIEDTGERTALARQGHRFFREHHTLRGLEALIPSIFEWV